MSHQSWGQRSSEEGVLMLASLIETWVPVTSPRTCLALSSAPGPVSDCRANVGTGGLQIATKCLKSRLLSPEVSGTLLDGRPGRAGAPRTHPGLKAHDECQLSLQSLSKTPITPKPGSLSRRCRFPARMPGLLHPCPISSII